MGIFKLLVEIWSKVDYANHFVDMKFTNLLLPNKKKDPRIDRNKNNLYDPESSVSIFKRSNFLYGLSILSGFVCTHLLYALLGLIYPLCAKYFEKLTWINNPIFIVVGYVILTVLFIIPFWRALDRAFDECRFYFDRYNNYPKKAKRNVIITGMGIIILLFIVFFASFFLMMIVFR